MYSSPQMRLDCPFSKREPLAASRTPSSARTRSRSLTTPATTPSAYASPLADARAAREARSSVASLGFFCRRPALKVSEKGEVPRRLTRARATLLGVGEERQRKLLLLDDDGVAVLALGGHVLSELLELLLADDASVAEPTAVGDDARGGEFLALQILLDEFSLLVTHGLLLVHHESAHSRRRPHALRAFASALGGHGVPGLLGPAGGAAGGLSPARGRARFLSHAEARVTVRVAPR